MIFEEAFFDMEKTMHKNIYGYIRVSSIDQHEDRQIIAMKNKQIPPDHLYTINSLP